MGNLSNYSFTYNTFTSTKYDLAQENIGDIINIVKHENLDSSKLTLSVLKNLALFMACRETLFTSKVKQTWASTMFGEMLDNNCSLKP